MFSGSTEQKGSNPQVAPMSQRAVNRIFKSDIGFVDKIPDMHPLFKNVDKQKLEYALAYCNGLTYSEGNLLTDMRHYGYFFNGSKNILAITTDKELFIKALKTYKANVTFHTKNELGISSTRVTIDFNYFSNTVVRGMYYLCNLQHRQIILYTENMDLVYTNLRTICKKLAVNHNRVYSLTPIFNDVITLNYDVRTFKELKQQMSQRLDHIAFKIESSSGYEELSQLLHRDENNSPNIKIIQKFYSLNMRNWQITLANNNILFQYIPIIIANHAYKDTANIETPLRYPYFIYDFQIRFNINGSYAGSVGKGYHPNRADGHNRLPEPEGNIKEISTVCVGTLQTKLASTNLETISTTDLTTLLNDVVIMLKTVNHPSGYWMPTPSCFLDKYQEYTEKTKTVGAEVQEDTPPERSQATADAHTFSDQLIEIIERILGLSLSYRFADGRTLSDLIITAVITSNPEELLNMLTDDEQIVLGDSSTEDEIRALFANRDTEETQAVSPDPPMPISPQRNTATQLSAYLADSYHIRETFECFEQFIDENGAIDIPMLIDWLVDSNYIVTDLEENLRSRFSVIEHSENTNVPPF